MSIQTKMNKAVNTKSRDFTMVSDEKDLRYCTKNPILNPQDEIPDVMSKYTVIKDKVEGIDLNENNWSNNYYVIFFHTG